MYLQRMSWNIYDLMINHWFGGFKDLSLILMTFIDIFFNFFSHLGWKRPMFKVYNFQVILLHVGLYLIWLVQPVFSRGHATLYFAVPVRRSICWSVTFLKCKLFFFASLPPPNHLRLWCCVSGLVLWQTVSQKGARITIIQSRAMGIADHISVFLWMFYFI